MLRFFKKKEKIKVSYAEIKQSYLIQNPKNVDESLNLARELFEEEDKRKSSIESKAFTLFSITGIATAVIFSASDLIMDKFKTTAPRTIVSLHFTLTTKHLIGLIILLYVLLCSSLIASIWYVVKALRLEHYAKRNADGVMDFLNKDSNEVKQEMIADFVYSYKRNLINNNDKGTLFNKAEFFFSTSLIMLLIISILFALFFVADKLI